LFGHTGRGLLDRLAIPDPWRRTVDASLGLTDDLELQIAGLTVELRRPGADHRYIPLLVTAIGWINAFTIASEIGDITRFSSPAKLCGYTSLCPKVKQSGGTDQRGPLCKHGPKYLRWALFEAALHACAHPVYADRYQRTKQRLGRQRAQGGPDRPLLLMTVAVAAAAAGTATISNTATASEGRFGTADYRLEFDSSDSRKLSADVAAARAWFGAIEAIPRQEIAVPFDQDGRPSGAGSHRPVRAYDAAAQGGSLPVRSG
jgi:hypothetical protein